MELTGEQGEQLSELSSSQVEFLRERCKTDLYFLSKAILGYTQLEEGAHAALCAFMVRERSNRRLVLMPRGFLKTTVCTISDSIRLSLIDPNVRILIQNEVFENAAGFLGEIKNHWVKGELLRFLFPELTPIRLSGPGSDWSKDSASINRSSMAKESTYTASGSGGSPQSKHFEKIKNDDLIGEKARTSDTEMKKAIGWVDAMTPLLDRLSDQIDFYGTRKTLSDTYAHVERKYASRIKVFIREPIENGDTIFSKFPLEELMHIMVDTPDVWAYDYMNNPVGAGGLDWGRDLLRYYSVGADDSVYYEDHLTGVLRKWRFSELDIVVTVDPNSGKPSAPDKAAVVVHGTSPREQTFILESKSSRWSPDGLVNEIFSTCERWHPRLVGIEDAGQQNTTYYFEKLCMEKESYYHTVAMKHDNKNKEVRIRKALDTPLKSRKIYVLRSMLGLISQVQLFPQLAVHNWDELDAMSYGPRLYQAGMTQEDLDADEEAENKILQIRGLTGYGNSVSRPRLVRA